MWGPLLGHPLAGTLSFSHNFKCLLPRPLGLGLPLAFVSNYRERHLHLEVLLYPVYSLDVARVPVDGEPYEPRVELLEALVVYREVVELRGADRREVSRVAEEHEPLALAGEVVGQLELPVGGDDLKLGEPLPDQGILNSSAILSPRRPGPAKAKGLSLYRESNKCKGLSLPAGLPPAQRNLSSSL